PRRCDRSPLRAPEPGPPATAPPEEAQALPEGLDRAPARPPHPRHHRLSVIALIQRVAEARVEVGSETVGAIGRGVLALVGVERGDGESEVARLADKVLTYRIFADPYGKMNFSLVDIQGALLAVPQFTLAAETRSGTRPGFSAA